MTDQLWLIVITDHTTIMVAATHEVTWSDYKGKWNKVVGHSLQLESWFESDQCLYQKVFSGSWHNSFVSSTYTHTECTFCQWVFTCLICFHLFQSFLNTLQFSTESFHRKRMLFSAAKANSKAQFTNLNCLLFLKNSTISFWHVGSSTGIFILYNIENSCRSTSNSRLSRIDKIPKGPIT